MGHLGAPAITYPHGLGYLLVKSSPTWCQVTPVCNFRQLYIAFMGSTYLDVSSFVLIWVSTINYHAFLDEACKLPSQHRHNLEKKKSSVVSTCFYIIPHPPSKEFFLLSLGHIPFLSQYILSLDVSHRQYGINNPVRQTASN